jgi:hypothetical protein
MYVEIRSEEFDISTQPLLLSSLSKILSCLSRAKTFFVSSQGEDLFRIILGEDLSCVILGEDLFCVILGEDLSCVIPDLIRDPSSGDALCKDLLRAVDPGSSPG